MRDLRAARSRSLRFQLPTEVGWESPPRNAGGFGSLRPPRAAPRGSEVPVGTRRELQKPRTPSSGLKFHAREVFL